MGCALLRSKCLPVLSDLYCTILYCTLQYCTVQSGNGTLHSCPKQSLGSLCRLNCNCPSIFVAVKFCLTFVLVSVFIVSECNSNTHFVITAILVISNKPAIECYLLYPL